MSTNIYRYQERIWYSDKPAEHWGWYMSTSSDGAGLTWFDSKKKQDKFIEKMNAAVSEHVGKDRREDLSGYPGEWEAMFVACYVHQSGPVDTVSWVQEELEDQMSAKLIDFLCELANRKDVREIIEG
jgi:hypothetical protein